MSDLYNDGPSSSDQYLRRWALTVSGPGGSLVLSDSNATGAQDGGTSTIDDALRITFRTRQATLSTRGNAEITVFNIDLKAIGTQIREFNTATLQAGYQGGQYGTIFKGEIRTWKIGRDPSFTETYLKLDVQQDMMTYGQAIVNATLPAGTTAEKAVKSAVNAMVPWGAAVGKIFGFSTEQTSRAITQVGMALDEVLTHGQIYGENGTTNAYHPSAKQSTTGGDIEINAGTGLVGMAEQTANAIEFTCLLNPKLMLQGIVHIDNTELNQINAGTGTETPSTSALGATQVEGPGIGQFSWFANQNADGRYTVWVIEHSGDSRGNDWYSHVQAWSADGAPSPGVTGLSNYQIGGTPKQAQVSETNTPGPGF